MFKRRKIGLKDIHGCDIREGDKLIVYSENYAKKLIYDNVYEVDQSKAGPLIDIVLFECIVEYVAPEFRGKVLNTNERGVSSISLDNYWLEVV